MMIAPPSAVPVDVAPLNYDFPILCYRSSRPTPDTIAGEGVKYGFVEHLIVEV